MPIQSHFFLINNDEGAQDQYREPDERYRVTKAQLNISESSLNSDSYREKLRFLDTVENLEISAPNLEVIDGSPFDYFTSLQTFKLSNTQISNLEFKEIFCSMAKSLKTLDLNGNKFNCSCNLTESIKALKLCFDSGIEIKLQCEDADGILRQIPEFETEKFCPITQTVASVPQGKSVHPPTGSSYRDQPSKATLVLIIILSVVLIAIILFAVILFVSNRYCYSKRSQSKYDSAKASNRQKELNLNSHNDSSPKHVLSSPLNLYGPQNGAMSNPTHKPAKASPSPPKQVKFRPLSREYQSIDGCPFDTQIPTLNSPERQKNMPYSISEQHEPHEIDENQNWPNDGEFHV